MHYLPDCDIPQAIDNLQKEGLPSVNYTPFDSGDSNAEFTKVASSYWQKANLEGKIELKLAPALDSLDELIAEGQSNSFDFIFIDADKSNYINYYEKSLQLVRKGGLIAIDNVLWYGRVADKEVTDNRTQKIRAFNQKLSQDDRIDISLLPLGDGLTLARKK